MVMLTVRKKKKKKEKCVHESEPDSDLMLDNRLGGQVSHYQYY